jgi:hypothetical protein
MARSFVLQQRPYTLAQTNLSVSFFACDTAADHTFLFADQPDAIPLQASVLRL